MESSEENENKSQKGDESKEHLHIELEAPADELIIKRYPAEEAKEEAAKKEPEVESPKKEAEGETDETEKRQEEEENKQEEEEKEESDKEDKPGASSKIVVAVGCVIAFTGLVVVWPLINWATGVAIIAIGAIIVAVGVLPRM